MTAGQPEIRPAVIVNLVEFLEGHDAFMACKIGSADAMPEDHILAEDIALVDVTETFSDGDIAAVQTEAGILVRHAWRQGGGLLLRTSRESEPVMVKTGDSVSILGKVVAIQRWLI